MAEPARTPELPVRMSVRRRRSWLPTATDSPDWCFTRMTFTRIASSALLGLWLCPTAQAGLPASSKNVYHAIVERNVFHLVPVPPPPPPPAPPLPEITLTGITTILPEKCALLKIRYPAGRGGPGREEACILRAGQREGPVEMLAIDERAGCVTVNNSGTLMTITFELQKRVQSAVAVARPELHPPIRLAVH